MTEAQSSNGIDVKPRANSIAQASENSQTAAEFIREQLHLEAEAREALPYQFDTCTRPLGSLRQHLFSCLTCNPPPANLSDLYTPAGVCYSCSISCHGEHTLVELFTKRDFICDCGTTRLPSTSPCTLRLNDATGQKGGVHSEEPAQSNRYNQNFRNRFCGCGQTYDPFEEKGTMFQCMGLGTVEEGGCGEDWWHPECVMGIGREEYQNIIDKLASDKRKEAAEKRKNGIMRSVNVTTADEPVNEHEDARRPSVISAITVGNPPDGIMRSVNVTTEEQVAGGDLDARRPSIITAAIGGSDGNDIAADAEEEGSEDEDTPLPPGFPQEEEFESFICYKCADTFPWIKRYAGTRGFLPPIYFNPTANGEEESKPPVPTEFAVPADASSRKRKSSPEDDTSNETLAPAPPKRQKSVEPMTNLASISETTELPISLKKEDSAQEQATPPCKLDFLPQTPSDSRFSIFLKANFRDYLCKCPSCFPKLKPHPPLLDEIAIYEPPLSVSGNDANGNGSVGTGSLYDRGEAAFSTMDRVEAIQGAMAFAHVRDKVKAFLKPFAESGQAVKAEDVKAYFEKLRGDTEGIQQAAGGAQASKKEGDDGNDGGDNRKEQSGY